MKRSRSRFVKSVNAHVLLFVVITLSQKNSAAMLLFVHRKYGVGERTEAHEQINRNTVRLWNDNNIEKYEYILSR